MNNQVVMLIIVAVAMIALSYFMTVRPQQKRFKSHQDLLNSLTTGDEVMTAGGFVGKLVEMDAENDYAIIALDPDGIKAKINIRSIVANMSQNKTID